MVERVAGGVQHDPAFPLDGGRVFRALLERRFDLERATHIASSAGRWFAFVLVYDLALLALLVALGGRLAAGTVPLLLLLNPADAFRMVNIFGFADVARLYGLAAVVPPSLASPLVQGAALAAWILMPLGIASWRFR